MEKHEIAAILSDTRYFIQNSHGDRLYDIEWQYKQGFLGFLALPVAKFTSEEKAKRFQSRANEVLRDLFDREFSD
ncbi:hypothetical protein EZJ55_00465 [Microcystis aeruginosa EAWAG127a]|uniref:Uncharacterized protein n=1 Tax=Microcystis aeruginosa EAWAG127a TaxID=2529855 RepID=A0A5J5M0N6_MICAE|nr:hypothetical protein [Microcystis aeruginosa]KAB0243976.1 hypothetical protein EZJ55_00035 [Microcystis aeruginosa EAWAG127a]KAB0243988.1 hypothetical protein EZJ55_00105 [Microcystis aeruginosa EAWAG127a]KAB0243995.1 hypothetical protein EZJ55_00160 [Microcystis aeruginosa EAWAG127a]KAB0244005.1 hypothetical protein EZJ55_00215 [Microcystis aeruginosa EAWAG127a]KAB0244013.1 hypothetical protein EZJ55_00265 [Microcystis aeruginosa EAWAG127a]